MKGRSCFFLYAAWVVSLIGTFMSLYASEILLLEPCSLCWYQRMALFPLALLLGIACYRSDRSFILYGAVLAAIGASIGLYHFIKGLLGSSSCKEGCSALTLQGFGLVSFPLFSVVGFALILVLFWASFRKSINTIYQK